MKRYVLFLFALVFAASSSHAATYYMANNPCSGNEGWMDGSNSNDGLSKATPFLTLQYAFQQMTAGDTLIIDDGIYTSSGNAIGRHTVMPYGNNGPDGIDGTPDDIFTTIAAENIGRVVFQGIQHEIYGNLSYDGKTGMESFTPVRFTEWNGFVYKYNSEPGFKCGHTKYLKIKNCGFTDNGDKQADNAQFGANYAAYLLIENCYSWGHSGYYFFWLLHCENTVMRNCVVRYDKGGTAYAQCGGISHYSCKNAEIQNCIVIDGDTGYENLGNYSGTAGCFANPATTPRKDNDYAPNRYTNCIALNVHQRYATSDHNNGGVDPGYRSYTFHTNCIAYDLLLPPTAIKDIDPQDYVATSIFGASGWTNIDQCTFMKVNTFSGEPGNLNFGLFYGAGDHNEMKNAILHDINAGNMFWNYEDVAYINITDFPAQYKVVKAGATVQNMTAIELTNQYLPLMGTAALNTAGEGSKRIGAEIINQYGKSGTFWGQPGYNLFQDGTSGQAIVKLWPFPNEDIMKEYMSQYSWTDPEGEKPDIDGKRGFCAAGKQLNGIDDITLTSYIWEYLGNPIPEDIYGSGTGIYDFDVNNDGNINVSDVFLCVNIILGAATGSADVNSDGQVNVQDVLAIVNTILQ